MPRTCSFEPDVNSIKIWISDKPPMRDQADKEETLIVLRLGKGDGYCAIHRQQNLATTG